MPVSLAAGGTMKAALFTLGCKVNQYETQIMEQRLSAAGYEIVPGDEQADVYVINSCTVTSQSDAKTRHLAHRLRRQSPGALIVLTGCLPQADPESAAALQGVDVVAGTEERARIDELVNRALAGGRRLVEVQRHRRGEPFVPMRAEGFTGHTRAFVKIEDGCENFCSYCIIPFARGPVRSKPLDTLRDELAGLAASGYSEAVLVGVELSQFGRDTGATLADALEIAEQAPGLRRVRLGSLDPLVADDAFIARARALRKLCPHFHLSLQSGSAETLRRMRRRYTPEQYAAAVDRLRAAFPGCAVTTDIIAGFPGETPAEFEESLAFVRRMQFAKCHVFVYSRRHGTTAASMPGQVPAQEQERRARILREAARVSRCAFLESHVGREIEALFETRTDGGTWEGFAADYTPVRVPFGTSPVGQFRRVLVTGCDDERCIGHALEGGTG